MRVRQAASAEGGDRQFVTALARGFDLLRAFTAADAMLGNQELAARTGLPKPTVSRLTYTLTQLGYLAYLPRFAKYQLGIAAVSLGQRALAGMSVRPLARPLMQRLAEEMDASVSLGSRDGGSMLYVEHRTSGSAIAIQLALGSRIPLAVTAMGRAYYAAASEEERAAIERQAEARDPAAWPAVRAGLEEARRLHAARGFAVSLGDWTAEVNAAAAPVPLPDGTILAVNCGAPAFRLDRARVLGEVGPRVAELARRISALMA